MKLCARRKKIQNDIAVSYYIKLLYAKGLLL